MIDARLFVFENFVQCTIFLDKQRSIKSQNPMYKANFGSHLKSTHPFPFC